MIIALTKHFSYNCHVIFNRGDWKPMIIIVRWSPFMSLLFAIQPLLYPILSYPILFNLFIPCSGMARSALWLASTVGPTLLQLMEEGYEIVIVGHSLGG
jgi:hypothetical protein